MSKKRALYQIAKVKFVVDGLSLAEIAMELDGEVSERTLQRWCAEHGWAVKREAFYTSEESDRELMQQIKRKLLMKALETTDPQVIYALARLEAVMKPGAAERLKEIEEREAARERAAGLTPETIDEIKRKVLGIE